MARLSDLPGGMAEHLLKLPLPEFDDTALVAGPPLADRRVAIVERRRARPEGRPGFLLVDTIHEGALDGRKGLPGPPRPKAKLTLYPQCVSRPPLRIISV